MSFYTLVGNLQRITKTYLLSVTSLFCYFKDMFSCFPPPFMMFVFEHAASYSLGTQ